MKSLAKDFKTISEAYTKIYEAAPGVAGVPVAPGGFLNSLGGAVMSAIGAGPGAARFQPDVYSGKGGATTATPAVATKGGAQSAATAAKSAAGAPVTSAGVVGGVSDSGPADAARQSFDKATTEYLKALKVPDADIKRFIDSTHTMLQGFSNKSAAPGINATPAAPSTAQYVSGLGGRGLTGAAGSRAAYASK